MDFFSLAASSVAPEALDEVLLNRIADVHAPLSSLITDEESALIISVRGQSDNWL
jgi:hypothetical protein